jgi:hypothetical protein
MHWAESESGSNLVATICDTEAAVQHERRGAHSLHCVFASPEFKSGAKPDWLKG